MGTKRNKKHQYANTKNELSRFDIQQAKRVVNIIRNNLRNDENSGLIDYKYLPDENKDTLWVCNHYRSKYAIGGFIIQDVYGNSKHIVMLTSDGAVCYHHLVPKHIGKSSLKYINDITGWCRGIWKIPADDVWDLIPKFDPK